VSLCTAQQRKEVIIAKARGAKADLVVVLLPVIVTVVLALLGLLVARAIFI
jgi:hypothetical protein